tara:strand:+ start:453 stop:776 length:324 start_codon:yes stop_codon:yes gene_type:complete
MKNNLLSKRDKVKLVKWLISEVKKPDYSCVAITFGFSGLCKAVKEGELRGLLNPTEYAWLTNLIEIARPSDLDPISITYYWPVGIRKPRIKFLRWRLLYLRMGLSKI